MFKLVKKLLQLFSTSVGRNAFAIMANAQRQLQEGDNEVDILSKLFTDVTNILIGTSDHELIFVTPNHYLSQSGSFQFIRARFYLAKKTEKCTVLSLNIDYRPLDQPPL